MLPRRERLKGTRAYAVAIMAMLVTTVHLAGDDEGRLTTIEEVLFKRESVIHERVVCEAGNSTFYDFQGLVARPEEGTVAAGMEVTVRSGSIDPASVRGDTAFLDAEEIPAVLRILDAAIANHKERVRYVGRGEFLVLWSPKENKLLLNAGDASTTIARKPSIQQLAEELRVCQSSLATAKTAVSH